jgi:hypothetical protein
MFRLKFVEISWIIYVNLSPRCSFQDVELQFVIVIGRRKQKQPFGMKTFAKYVVWCVFNKNYVLLFNDKPP